jgi:hypothetical protein
VGVDHVLRLGVEQHHLDPVDAGHAAHLLERGVDAAVELIGRQVHERRGQPHQPALVDEAATEQALGLGLGVDQAEGDHRGPEGGDLGPGHTVDVHGDPFAVGELDAERLDRAGARPRPPGLEQPRRDLEVVGVHELGHGTPDQRPRVVAGDRVEAGAGERDRAVEGHGHDDLVDVGEQPGELGAGHDQVVAPDRRHRNRRPGERLRLAPCRGHQRSAPIMSARRPSGRA